MTARRRALQGNRLSAAVRPVYLGGTGNPIIRPGAYMVRGRIVATFVSAALALVGGFGSAVAQARPEVQGTAAAVVADHPLAAAAGADVLRRGGNAVDAAITMAAVLAVVRPHMNGIGGDAFLLIREGRSGRVHALNGSGRAGSLASAAWFRARGYAEMPTTGVTTVTVPGAVRAWADALRRHGSISLAQALAPAINYAGRGFPVSAKLAADIAAQRQKLTADPAMAAVFLPGGAPPAVGSLLRQPDLARSLQLLARDGAEALYTGELAQRLDLFMAAETGVISINDMADHSSTWQQPITTTYAGFRVLAFPPNSQGVALLMQMNMAELFDLSGMGHNTAAYVAALADVTRLAFAERDRYVTDPAFAEVPLDRMLSKQWAAEAVARRDAGLRPEPTSQHGSRSAGGRAATGDGAGDGDGDTVFLAVVDAQGNAVSLIQSLYNAFGSGRMIPGTGIVLHNRGALFTLEQGSVHVIAPRKRPYHTLAPAMVLNGDGSLRMVLGTPGSDGQTQTLLQVFNNMVLFGMTPQRAVEAPRWRWWPDGRLQVEEGIAASVRDGLAAAGWDVRLQFGMSAELGGAQVIMISPTGVKSVGADPRREAYGIAW
jgi:gamma-glutamyltranspeptidase / glutathione hydrolase